MNRSVLMMLRELGRMHPRVFFRDSTKIRPLGAGVLSELVGRYGDRLAPSKVRAAVSLYQCFRSYAEATNSGRRAVNLEGVEIEGPAEALQISQPLMTKSILECCNLLADPATNFDRAAIIARLQHDYWELSFLVLGAAAERDHRTAFQMGQQIRLIAEALSTTVPPSIDQTELESSRYNEATFACARMELTGSFAQARQYAEAAARSAKLLRTNIRNFFPNQFFDETDIASYDVYLNALEFFKNGSFADAASHFDKWLALNIKRKNKGNADYNTKEFLFEVCIALDRVKTSSLEKDIWDKPNSVLSSPGHSIFRTARSLWNRLEPLRALTRERRNIRGADEIINNLLRMAQEEWRLLSKNCRFFDSNDLASSLGEPIRLPKFLDVFQCIPSVDDHWPYLMMQNLRNSLILKADYEMRLRANIYGKESHLRVPLLASYEIESLTDKELVAYNRRLVMERSSKDLEVWDKRIPEWWQARAETRSGDFAGTKTCLKFLSNLRAFPHVLRILSNEESSFGLGQKNQSKRKVRAQRVWRYQPSEILLQGDIDAGSKGYAYLRPRWNTRLDTSYEIRDRSDMLIESRVPEWMVFFELWASGLGKVQASSFLRWCNQIEREWRTVALRLLSRVTFYSEADILSAWRSLYRATIPAELKTNRTVYVGLGPASKSGHHQLYPLRQAIEELPESELGFRPSESFSTIDALSEHAKIDSIVFVDDLIATGDQATKFIESELSKYPWLKTRRIYVCCLVAFDEGVERIQTLLQEFSGRLFAFQRMTSADRAFAANPVFWDSDQDRERAREWCRQIGKALWPDSHPDENALGWKGSEALVAFHYNTPNNTLPLFWAGGSVNNRPWHRLLPRIHG
jgi:hypothetical protein